MMDRRPSLAFLSIGRAPLSTNHRTHYQILFLVLVWFCIASGSSTANAANPKSTSDSLASSSLTWPNWEDWKRVILLTDYNSRVVVFGTAMLGCAAGLVGSFTLLRKRALMGDALSHATLPGIGIAYILATVMGGNGKSLPILLLGATLSGLLGVAAILAIRNLTRLKEDAALGIVLSVFFGAGVALLGVIQNMETGHAAGLEAFIYGKTASMGINDAYSIGGAGLFCILVCLVLLKEFKLLCFDENFAGADGYPVLLLDMALMSLVVIVSIVGLQAVGLILMIALLVIPAAAARFWTQKLGSMALISAGLGTVSGMVGAGMSALFAKLPSGAMIVLVCTTFFLISLFMGRERGVLIRWYRRFVLNRTIDRQHLLRAIYESIETTATAGQAEIQPEMAISMAELFSMRSWSQARLKGELFRCQRQGLLGFDGYAARLTPTGFQQAEHLTHQHRLWELYLINYADIAASRVDQDADAIEHVLEPEVIQRLERLLEKEIIDGRLASPHALTSVSHAQAESDLDSGDKLRRSENTTQGGTP